MNNNILYVYAHFDDEIFSIGTILKQLSQHKKITLLFICNEHDGRKAILENNIKKYPDLDYIFLEYKQLTLHTLSKNQEENIKSDISFLINDRDINTVYTHFKYDIHSDHRAVSNLVRVVCRADRSSINELYETYTPGSSEYGDSFNISNWTNIVDVTDYQIDKNNYIDTYEDHLKCSISKTSIQKASAYFGMLYNKQFVEIFKLIYKKEN